MSDISQDDPQLSQLQELRAIFKSNGVLANVLGYKYGRRDLCYSNTYMGLMVNAHVPIPDFLRDRIGKVHDVIINK